MQNACTFIPDVRGRHGSPGPVDPLGSDKSSDRSRTLTNRQIGRLLLIASEVGARFQRDQVQSDALQWMYEPKRLFHGLSAVEAVIDLNNFQRAHLLHAFGIGLDADPDLMDNFRFAKGNSSHEELVLALLESADVRQGIGYRLP